MNYSIIFKMLSMVLWVMALAFSACTGVSLLYGASPLESEAMPSWICVIALCVMLAFALYLLGKAGSQALLHHFGDGNNVLRLSLMVATTLFMLGGSVWLARRLRLYPSAVV